MMHITCDLIIDNCTLLNPDYSFSEDMSIAVQNGKIQCIDKKENLSKEFSETAECIDAEGKLAMPGLIDGHTHISQQLMRGVLANEFPVLYQRFNMPFENVLNREDMKVSAELAAVEMIKSGITAFADAGSDYLETVVPVIEQSGLRAVLTRPSSDIGDHLPAGRVDTTADAVHKSLELYRAVNGAGNGRIQFWFQYRSARSCSKELITAMVGHARDYQTGLHAHLSEYPESNLKALQEFGMREIEYLDSLDALGSNFLAAHCIQISDHDIRILAERGVHVVHCPRSNLGKGVTKTPQLLGAGVSVGLGTDGTAHAGLNLFREMTAFRYSQAAFWGAPYCDYQVANSRELIDMVTMGGARALLLDERIGSLEVGKEADLILIDIDKPHIQPTHNLLNTLTETVDISDITDLFVRGAVVMRNRELLTLDEERIAAESKTAAADAAKRVGWGKRPQQL